VYGCGRFGVRGAWRPGRAVSREPLRQHLGYNPTGMLVGIGCAIGLVVAIAIMCSYKTRSKQARNRTFRDYVRRNY
jgi:hypothetical protein